MYKQDAVVWWSLTALDSHLEVASEIQHTFRNVNSVVLVSLKLSTC